MPKGECDTDRHTHTHGLLYIELNDFILPQGRQQKGDAAQTDPGISKKCDVTIELLKKRDITIELVKKRYVTIG